MSNSSDIHNALVAKAAKFHLGAIGMMRKGRSRLWLKDNRWWVVVVEFQPSSWTKGSYLNVAAMWLWNVKDHWSFDQGNRVEGLQAFENVDQFSLAADKLAMRAKEEALALCRRFPSVSSVASHLASKPSHGGWNSYHAAMAALAAGDVVNATTHFNTLLDAEEHAQWVSDLKVKVRDILQRLASTPHLDIVSQEISQARALLKLSAVDPTRLWDNEVPGDSSRLVAASSK